MKYCGSPQRDITQEQAAKRIKKLINIYNF